MSNEQSEPQRFPIPPQTHPLIFVLGPAGHGKTTVREMIQEKLGVPGDSTSNVLYAFLALLTGKTEDELHALPKEELRPRLIELGDWFTMHRDDISPELRAMFSEGEAAQHLDEMGKRVRDPAALVRMLFLAGARVYDGVRRVREFRTALHHLVWCGYVPVVVWVENSLKEKNANDNLTLTKELVHPTFVIQNEGTLDDLELEVEKILEKLGWKPVVVPAADEPVILNSRGEVATTDKSPTIHT